MSGPLDDGRMAYSLSIAVAVLCESVARSAVKR